MRIAAVSIIPESEIPEIIRELCGRTGINWHYYRAKYIIRRLEYRMQKIGMTDYKEYLKYLEKDDSEAKELIDSFGVNVSSFFRDNKVFELLGSEIFPRIMERKKAENANSLNVWCAGCATGEEPYSVSIILSELLNNVKPGIKVKIIATDIDEAALESARKGKYSAEKLTLIGDRLLKKYFTIPDEAVYEASETIKEQVKFKQHDLIGFPPPLIADIILCRNMLIYIKPEYQLSIFEKFYSSLPRGGFLVIGKSEYIPREFHGRFKAHNQDERIYFKDII